MRIAVVTFVLNSHSGARAAVETAKTFTKMGNTIDLICTPQLFDAALADQLNSAKLHIHQVSNPLKLFSLLLSLRPNVISFHGILSQLLICRFTDIPVYSHYYGTQFVNPLLNTLIYLKTLLLVWLPHKIYGISNYTSAECHRLYGRKITTIYLGCDHLTKSTNFKKIRSTAINLLSVSRLVPYKGFDRLIRIANILPCTLTIAGSQPNLRYLAYLKSISTPKITILTNISDDQLIKLYQNTDIYLSADRYLFFGLPILEAATFKIPTVTLSHAAASEVVINGSTGFVTNSDTEFVQHLRQLIANKPLRKKLGLAAQKHSLNFSWQLFTKSLQKQYKYTT